MRAVPATDAEAQDWDQLVTATGRPHIVQTRAWAARRFILDDGERRGVTQVLTRRLPLGVTVAYAARGPLVAPEHLVAAITALRDVLARERCASLLCDPEVPA